MPHHDPTVRHLLKRHQGVLDPIERVAEINFGLIMVLTFTGSLSVASAGRADVREMLIGALGCNLAWGIIDAVMYATDAVVDRARKRTMVRAVQQATDPAGAGELLRMALPEGVAMVIDEAGLRHLVDRIRTLPAVEGVARLELSDLKEAALAGVLVVLVTLPVALPFLFIHEVGPALRASNAVAVSLLFFSGYTLARASGLKPWLVGGLMVLVGVALVALTIALGG